MRRLILPTGVLRLIALYESLAGVIYHDTVGMNITVREDCVVSEPAISFLFPFGKIFQLFQDPETKRKKNAIVTGVASNTFFEKNSGRGVTKQGGGNCDSQWWEMMFFGEFFPKAATQRGVVLDITPVDGLCFFLRKVENGCNKMGWQS